jgi:hypothetical protein
MPDDRTDPRSDESKSKSVVLTSEKSATDTRKVAKGGHVLTTYAVSGLGNLGATRRTEEDAADPRPFGLSRGDFPTLLIEPACAETILSRLAMRRDARDRRRGNESACGLFSIRIGF